MRWTLLAAAGMVGMAFAVGHDVLVAKLAVGAAVGLFFSGLLAAAAHWVLEGYGPAARRRRRGAEQIVGPEGRARLPMASPPPRAGASLGPAFHLTSTRVRTARHNERRRHV